MQAKHISTLQTDHLLDEGKVSLIKGKHGWKLGITTPAGDIWRISSNVRYLWVLADRLLAIKTVSGNTYMFETVGCTAAEAIDRFNQVVGLIW